MPANGVNEWERHVIYLYVLLTTQSEQQGMQLTQKKKKNEFKSMSEWTSAYTSECQIFLYAWHTLGQFVMWQRLEIHI